MTDEIAIERLKGIDIKFFLNGSTEQSDYIVDEADKINVAIERVLNFIQKQQHIIEGKEALIDTQSHNEEVYMKALEKQEKRIKDLEAKLNAKEILMNTLPEETDFIILTKEDYSRNYTEELQKKEAIIDLMADNIYEDDSNLGYYLCRKYGKCTKEMIIEYFKRKVTDMNVGEQDK